MAIKAGDLRQLVIDHDELGQLTLEHKSGEDVTLDPGGFRSNDDDGNITSALQRIDQQNAKPWRLETTYGLTEDSEDYLNQLKSNYEEATITATFSGNIIGIGTGKCIGDIVANKQAGTIAIILSGSGTFEEI